jgi:hypothetical protein
MGLSAAGTTWRVNDRQASSTSRESPFQIPFPTVYEPVDRK